MGLDQYLTRKIYVGANYEHNKVTGTIKIKKEGKPLTINLDKVTYIQETAGYWRKANQIHNWFVKNIQEGEDDCKEYYVDKERMKDLLLICKRIKRTCKLIPGAVTNGYSYENGVRMPIIEEGEEMTNPDFAAKLLPTQEGFFFGSSDYNQYYMDDIDSTIEILEPILADINDTNDYYYNSSW